MQCSDIGLIYDIRVPGYREIPFGYGTSLYWGSRRQDHAKGSCAPQMKRNVNKRRKSIAKWKDAYSYRIPMQITLYIQQQFGDTYPICPRCSSSMERDFQDYCDQCGQKLRWDRLGEVRYIKAGDTNRRVYVRRRTHPVTGQNQCTEELRLAIPNN